CRSVTHMPTVLAVVCARRCRSSYSLSWRGDRRDLPAFPTRRSSDLSAGSHCLRAGIGHFGIAVRPFLLRGIPAGKERAADPIERSEEHTSELQSRENLVCRLLLEKKKATKTKTKQATDTTTTPTTPC